MTPQLAPLDPRSLTAAKRDALELIHDHRLFANAGNYYGRPPHSITRTLARSLIHDGLVRLDNTGGTGELRLTGNGLVTFKVMLERRQRRRA